MKSNIKKKLKQFNCPNCNWQPPYYDGTFYKIENDKIILDLCYHDLEETGLLLPDEYYPKFDKQKETHFCPNCKKEFNLKLY